MSLLVAELDTMWAAGLFEGEGSVGYHGRPGPHGRRGGRLLLGMKDEGMVRRFAAAVRAGKIYKRNTGSAVWQWQTTTRSDFAKVAALLYPWLGSRRRACIEEAFRVSLLPPGTRYDAWSTRRRRANVN